MADQGNSNTTLEMGRSDQALESKKRRKLTYIIGGVAMVVVIAVTVTLVVLLSDNGTAGEAQPIVSTEGPTTVSFTTTESTTAATTPSWTLPPTSTTEAATTTQQPLGGIELEDVINGVFSAPSFNGTWATGTEVLFRNAAGDLVLYDVDTDSTVALVQNNSEILQQASGVTQLSPDGSNVVLSYGSIPVYRHSFLARYSAIDVTSATVVDIAPPNVEATQAYLQNFAWGPSGTSCVFVYLNNIFYKPSLQADAQQLTTTGQVNVIYHGIPDWVYEEEVFGSNSALWLSRDGGKLAYATFDDTNVRVMRVPHYGVPGSVEYQYTQHHEIRYPKPGTTNPTVSVTLTDITTGVNTVYNAPTTLDEPILKAVSFATNTSIALMWTNRVQTSMIVQLCEEGQTACNEIFSYTETEGWIDNIPFIFNEEGTAFITILPQNVNGMLYKQIVQLSSAVGTWTVTNRINTAHTVADILKWTSDDIIWYKATSPTDSAEQHIYSVDSSNTVSCFTCDIVREDGAACLYNDGVVSSTGERLTVNCAGPEIPQIYVYNANGQLLRTWDSNSEVASLLASDVIPQTIRLQVPVAEGYPDADVNIQVPADYESRTNVPLLVYVYGGPDTALVTKQWAIDWGTSLVSRWGIAVATIDGRGSGLRGVSNTFALNRALGSVEIEDQINVTRYLQNNLTWLDANRTCIWGWSYGGYASSLALARGEDVFRCAIAVAPVTDWRFYDTIYTERYMGTPQNNSEGYVESSLLSEDVVAAFRNKHYFLVHGTADDNVHYQHAMLLSRLLQRRDVMFSQMTYTDQDHGLAGVRPHLYHALEQFLQDYML